MKQTLNDLLFKILEQESVSKRRVLGVYFVSLQKLVAEVEKLEDDLLARQFLNTKIKEDIERMEEICGSK